MSSIFREWTKSGDALQPGNTVLAANGTGAAIVQGTCVAYDAINEKVLAPSTAAICRYPLLIALANVANSTSAIGTFTSKGRVLANVDSGVSTTNSVLMPTTAATGGAALVVFAAGTKGVNVSCGFNLAAGAGTTLTYVLFDGESGRVGGYNESA